MEFQNNERERLDEAARALTAECQTERWFVKACPGTEPETGTLRIDVHVLTPYEWRPFSLARCVNGYAKTGFPTFFCIIGDTPRLKHVRHGPDCGDQETCAVCLGGLFWCSVCGAAEGELTTDCPGEKMGAALREATMRGQLDFKDGTWCPGRGCSALAPDGPPKSTTRIPLFALTEELRAQARAWMDGEHAHPKMKTDAIGGQFTWLFTPTAIGTVVRLRCACGGVVDLGHYEDW